MEQSPIPAVKQPNNVFAHSTLSEVLDDLCVRFIVFLPAEEQKAVERICFGIEEAHWFYEDFVKDLNPQLPNISLRNFIHQIFNHLPLQILSRLPQERIETAFADFMTYKKRVPVRGVIMLNMAMNKCVLVKGWKSGSSWSFPRGKINQDESDRNCAIREALEETGYDLTGMIGEDDFIEIPMRDQSVKLFIAPGVPEDAVFEPKTRNEISRVEWHRLCDLPGYSVKKGSKGNDQVRSGKFYMVAPFMRDIKRWISTTGKKWLAEQQKAAAAQQHEITDATADFNIAAIEREVEPEVQQPVVSPTEDTAEGLRHLLGINSAADVLHSGEMTSSQQEEASRRLKELLTGGPSAPEPDNMGNGIAPPAQPLSLPPPKNHVNYENLAPNAKTLLGILQSGNSPAPVQTAQAPPPPASQPPPQQFVPHTGPPHPAFPPGPQGIPQGPPQQFGMPMNHGPPPPGPYTGFTHQPPPPQQPERRPSMGPGFQNSPVRPNNGWPQQGPNGPRHMGPGGYLPSPPPSSRFAVPPPPAVINNQPAQYAGLQQQFQSAAGKPQQQLNHHAAFHQQIPPTPADSFAPPPPVPIKPPDPTQAGTLLSILKGAPPPVSNSENIPPGRISTPQRQQHQPPPQQPQTPVGQQQASRARPSPQAHQPPRHPRNHPQRPSTSTPKHHGNSTFTPPPPRPGTTAPAGVSPLLHPKTPTIIDHYGNAKPTNPTAQPATFDRRTSVAGEQALTLLAMFKNENKGKAPAEETAVRSPEGRLAQVAALDRASMSTPGGTVKPKDRAGLLAYLEDVARGA